MAEIFKSQNMKRFERIRAALANSKRGMSDKITVAEVFRINEQNGKYFLDTTPILRGSCMNNINTHGELSILQYKQYIASMEAALYNFNFILEAAQINHVATRGRFKGQIITPQLLRENNFVYNNDVKTHFSISMPTVPITNKDTALDSIIKVLENSKLYMRERARKLNMAEVNAILKKYPEIKSDLNEQVIVRKLNLAIEMLTSKELRLDSLYETMTFSSKINKPVSYSLI